MCEGNREPSGRGWSLLATAIATCLGLSLGLFPETALASAAIGQQEFEPLPAARRAPSGLAEIRSEAPPLPRPPSVQELLDIVARQPGGREKIDRAQRGRLEGMLPSSARVPGELEERGRRPMPALGPPPSVDELLESVRHQPGGRQKVGAALRLRRERSGGSGPLSWLRRLNPFGVKTATAAPDRTGEWASEQRQECPDSPSLYYSELDYLSDYCTTNPTAWAKFYGGSELHRSWAVLRPYSNPASWGSFGHRIEKPLAMIHFDAR